MSSSRYDKQFIPPPDPNELAREPMSAEECIRAWIKLMDDEDARLRAELQVLVGPNRDISPYRVWHELMQEDSDCAKEHMYRELSRRERDRKDREASNA